MFKCGVNGVFVHQEAVQCDSCNKWQHGTCNTGISRADYRAAVQL